MSASNGYVETLPAVEQPAKSFQVVEINETAEAANEAKPKRVYRRRTPLTRKKAAEA